jgi:uncharacterized membrane protein
MSDSTDDGVDGTSTSWVSSWTWRVLTTFAASLLGIGVATYLTLVHFSSTVVLSCPGSGKVFNCEEVTTSAQSYFLHIPVAVLGLAFFVTMLVLSFPRAWHSTNRLIAPTRLLASAVGMVFVFYLVYAELFEIKAICFWCTSVHILTFIVFIAVVTGWDEATSAWYAWEDDA